MQGEQQQIKQAARAVGDKVKETAAGNVDKTVKKATKEGKEVKDILGLTDVMIEGMYGQAYRLYNTGKYRDASQIFRLLLMINATEVKYAMGFAACFHMLKEYKGAAAAYTLVSSMDPESPVPFYHASDCYIKQGDLLSATVALEMAIKRAGNKPEFRAIKDRATMTIQGLRKELGIKEKSEKTEKTEG
jgi:type III secretion system low calcium response chaperone LcrH/SycD